MNESQDYSIQSHKMSPRDYYRYLRNLSSVAAVEIDDSILGRINGLSSVQGLTKILETYQLKDNFLTEPHFPYMPLWRAMMNNSDKKINLISELALEMRLLRYELESMNVKNLKGLRSFLVDFSRELSYELNL